MTTDILLSISSSSENYNEEVDHALVKLDVASVDLLLRRITLARDLRAADVEFLNLEYLDWSPVFCSRFDGLEGYDLPEAGNDGPDFTVLNDPLEVPEESIVRMEFIILVVDQDGASWRAVPKYSEVELCTGQISRQSLEELRSQLSKVAQ